MIYCPRCGNIVIIAWDVRDKGLGTNLSWATGTVVCMHCCTRYKLSMKEELRGAAKPDTGRDIPVGN